MTAFVYISTVGKYGLKMQLFVVSSIKNNCILIILKNNALFNFDGIYHA